MKLPWMNRTDRRRWKSARNLADLAELTALWLEGDLASHPSVQPNYGPDEETADLVPTLAALNRSGFLTACSQPGLTGPGADGMHWRQRAAVEGFVTDRTLYYRLLAAAHDARLAVAVHDHQIDAHDDPVVITKRDGEPYTALGTNLNSRELRVMWPGIRREAFADVLRAVHLTIAAPEYGPGGQRLWPALADVTALSTEDEHTHPGGNCTFCAIAAGQAPATVVREWPDALAIKPRGGVNPGHTLVIPRRHVDNATEDPATTGATMTRAAELAAEAGADVNLITSVGPDATQTVYHLHIHIVPRAKGDGLPLPWTPQQEAARKADAR